uniref:F-box domain-containing protein n=1 Tax=Bactrocera dorsalis TaxID=27457 RepID=A0A034V8Z7_BACDO
MIENELQVTIGGLPKMFSIYKLTSLLNRHTSSWELENLIPLEDHIIANIRCETNESYECLLQLPENVNTSLSTIRVYNASLTSDYVEQNNPYTAPSDSILKLNSDCLRLIFVKCSLKEQITLAKVCRNFHKIIMDIFSMRFHELIFSDTFFTKGLGLSDEEIWDLCILSGPYVRTLEFSSAFSLQLLTVCTENRKNNMRPNAKQEINIWMCKHLVHFPQIRTFKVLGGLLVDFTVAQLARYCPEVREFLVLDPNNIYVLGKNFHLLRKLEVLDLPLCVNMCRVYILKACKKLQLKSLNIVEVRRLMYLPFLKQIFSLQFKTLRQLWLTAYPSQLLIWKILALPHLENLKFYWPNEHVRFEKILFKELFRQRRDSLYSLCWETEPPFMVNASFVEWQPYEKETRYEVYAIKGAPWNCFERYAEWIDLIHGCTGIETMTFRYSRILSNGHILALPNICRTLKTIHMVGCCQESDQLLLNSWYARTNPTCELRIEGLNWIEVQELKRKELSSSKQSKTVYRSILCKFKNSINQRLS